MSKHNPDLLMCLKRTGFGRGRVCIKCDGRCVLCDSFVHQAIKVNICDECNFGPEQGRCIICNNKGVSDAYYCSHCVSLEKDREGCPKIMNLNNAKVMNKYNKQQQQQTKTS